MVDKLRTLIAGGDGSDVDAIRDQIKRSGWPSVCQHVADGEALREMLETERWDMLIYAFAVPGMGPLEAIRAAVGEERLTHCIVLQRELDIESASTCIRAGARDVVSYGNLERLGWALRREKLDAEARLKAEQLHRELQEQFLQSQKMEAVGQLAGGIAHDFNNALTVILSFAGFVRDELSANDPRREDIAEVLRAADRATSLTKQLLAFSRHQTGEPATLSLNDLIMSLDKMLRRTLGAHIELVTLLPPDLWPVTVDPGHFEQVVMNLSVNARHAMKDGGTLTLSTANVQADARKPASDVWGGQHVVLRVSDTGVGMPDHVRKRIFEPFFTTKEPGKGTGLGLATSYGVVQQAGGDIRARSQVGRGTTFEIAFPRAEGAPSGFFQAVGLTEDLTGKETVLVVEDTTAVLRLTTRSLNRAGYTVLPASQPAEAFRLAEECGWQIDLLVTDVVMPQMSGKDLAERAAMKNPEIKVLFMTGYADQDLQAGQHAEGPRRAVLHKPFSPQKLLRAVRDMLDA